MDLRPDSSHNYVGPPGGPGWLVKVVEDTVNLGLHYGILANDNHPTEADLIM